MGCGASTPGHPPEVAATSTEIKHIDKGTNWSDEVCDTKRLGLVIVVLGASGDLAKKKSFPSLHALFANKLLPNKVHIFGYARSDMSDEKLRDRIKPMLKGATAVDEFLQRVTYVKGRYDAPEDFSALNELIQRKETDFDCARQGRLFYLALPPSVYPSVCTNLKVCADESSVRWSRLIVEKPFGKDLASSEELAKTLGALYPESQLYRIDHYLGKEIVQNMPILRFGNMGFMAMWSAEYISNIQITFKENFGTEGRGGYFDEFGIIRDVIQNHLLQVLAVVAMELPRSNKADDIRDQKVKVLNCLDKVRASDCVLGQYIAANGKPGYLEDSTVPAGSVCPTFASIAFRINNERWKGVPFILKAGKALDERKCEVRIQFKEASGQVFGTKMARNELVLRIQPDEGMWWKVNVKEPGMSSKMVMTELDMSYNQRYEGLRMPDAYERLILDAVKGDQQYFVRRDELRAAWACVDDLLHEIDAGKVKLVKYPYGGRGPAEADALAKAEGFVRSEGYKYKASS